MVPAKNINLSLLASCSQGLGTEEEVLIEILASRNNMEIIDIKKAYKEGAWQQILSNDHHQASVRKNESYSTCDVEKLPF